MPTLTEAMVPRLVVPVDPKRRRTDLILEAIRKELEARRESLNTDAAVRSVSVVVKLKQGTPYPRAVIISVESETEL